MVGNRFEPHPPEMHARARALLDEGVRRGEICRRLGVSYSWLNIHFGPARKGLTGNGYPREIHEQARALLDKGLQRGEVVRRLSVSYCWLRKYFGPAPRSGGKVLSTEVRVAMQAMRERGRSYGVIARCFKVNLSTARRWCSGVPCDPLSSPLTPFEIARLRKLRLEGKRTGQIAKIVGRSVGAVYKHTRDLPKPLQARLPSGPILEEMLARGRTPQDIMREFGVGKSALNKGLLRARRARAA